jgi:hypothetical protein
LEAPGCARGYPRCHAPEIPVKHLVNDPAVGIEEIGAWLDELDHPTRLAATRTLSRADQRTLYQKAAAGPMLTATWFASSAEPIEHHGKNSLPLPASMREFSKHFALAEDGVRLFGFNESVFRSLVGPGCFVAYDTAGHDPAWVERGSVVVDYFQVPDGPVPASFPKVIPNSQGLQMFVYNRTRDFMRGVSKHVSIGAAYKGEKAMGQFFVLCKEHA